MSLVRSRRALSATLSRFEFSVDLPEVGYFDALHNTVSSVSLSALLSVQHHESPLATSY